MKTELEIVKEGYRADVAETLAAIGGKITEEMLLRQAVSVARKQADYVAEAVRMGLMLEAKFAAVCRANRDKGKQNLRNVGVDTRVHTDVNGNRAGNGERTRFTANGHACPFADDENKERNEKNVPESFPAYCERVFGAGTERNMRRYRWLGRRYLRAATEALQTQSSELAKALQAEESFDAEAVMLAVASGNAGGLTLRNWIAGRSLSQLITVLRQADAEACREEAEERARENAKAALKAEEEESGPVPDDAPEDPDAEWKQMNLPLEIRAAKQEVARAFEKLDAASGIAPKPALFKLWTDYRNALAAKVRAADAKLALLKN